MRNVIDLLARRSHDAQWVKPHALEYFPLDEQLAVVRVVAGLDRRAAAPRRAGLVVGTPTTISRTAAIGSVTHPTPRRSRTAEELLWRVTFALPLELVEYPEAVFGLVAPGRAPACLPQALRTDLASLSQHWPGGSAGLIAAVNWRRAAALGTAAAVAGSSVVPPAVAFAASGHHHHAPAVVRVHHPAAAKTLKVSHPSRQPATASVPDVQHHQPTPTATSHASRSLTHHPGATSLTPGEHQHPHRSPRHSGVSAPASHSGSQPQATPTSPPRAPSVPSTSSTPSTPSTPGTQTARRHHHHHHHGTGGPGSGQNGGSSLSSISTSPPASLQGPHGPSHHRRDGYHRSAGHHQAVHHHRTPPAAEAPHHLSGGASLPTLKPATSTPLATASHPAASDTDPSAVATTTTSSATSGGVYWTTGMGVSPTEMALIKHLTGLTSKLDQPPKRLIPIYKAAGRRFHIPWEILAAINSIETDYGRNLNVSPAGAVGWMQFMPATWQEYGMAVNGHAPANPYDPTDAIFSAARYLAANGAVHHLRKAIFAYNHALWYVDSVMWRAGLIAEHAQGTRGLDGYALPLDGRYMHTLGRTDDGLDIEDAPDGAAVYSITPGVVTAVASDPTGFGPNYPVIRVTKGPLTGQYIYYGHVAAALVKPGQHVKAGQPIAIMGHTGDAAYLGHGHIEIGFSDGYGDPINHHTGAGAWTPAGAAMRKVLVALAASFHIKAS